MKIVYYGESPIMPTGTGLLSRNILRFLIEMGHEIVGMAAINHFVGDNYDHDLYPFPIYGTTNDLYSYEEAKHLITNAEYDLLFLSADLSQINELYEVIRDAKQKRSFPVAVYSCIDCDVINTPTLVGLTLADHIVMYSQHSRRIALQHIPALNVKVINPGCDPDVFCPLPDGEREKARKEIFNIEDDRFLVVSVERNQWRKDPVRTMMIFHEFHQLHPKSLLYMHMKAIDVGGNLPMAARMLGMKMVAPNLEIMLAGPDFNERDGVSLELLNKIYCAADCFVSTTHGEGWGLTKTNAMSACCPVIVPRNSSMVEIVGEREERGYLVECGGDIDHLIVPYGHDSNTRPIVHSDDMIKALEEVLEYREKADAKAMQARAWTLQHTWGHAREQWQSLFAEIESKCGALEVV